VLLPEPGEGDAARAPAPDPGRAARELEGNQLVIPVDERRPVLDLRRAVDHAAEIRDPPLELVEGHLVELAQGPGKRRGQLAQAGRRVAGLSRVVGPAERHHLGVLREERRGPGGQGGHCVSEPRLPATCSARPEVILNGCS
jgi:hypothetical protein